MHIPKILVSQTKTGLCIIVLLCSAFLSANNVTATAGNNQSRKVPIHAMDGGNNKYISSGLTDFWHDGVNTSTPEVNVNYTTECAKPNTERNHSPWGTIGCIMYLNYTDVFECRVEFMIGYAFYDGGLNYTTGQVVNWSLLRGCSEGIAIFEHTNGSWVSESSCGFGGFTIVNGSAINYINRKDASMVFGRIDYGNVIFGNDTSHKPTAKIGIVELTNQSYVVNGTVLKESIAHFNVTVNASISKAPLTSAGAIDLPVVLKFNVTHNITQTSYKYDLDINWSSNKDFPTIFPMSTGSDYSLVAEDHVSCCCGNGKQQIEVKIFNTNPSNDTATWNVNGTVLGKQYFTTQFNINGTGPPNPTKCYNETFTNNGSVYSEVIVWFAGFQYNITTGFSFDPKVVLYNWVGHTSPIVPDCINIILPAITIIAIFAIVSPIKKKKFIKDTCKFKL